MDTNVPIHTFDVYNQIEILEMLVRNSNWIDLGWNYQSVTILKKNSNVKLQNNIWKIWIILEYIDSSNNHWKLCPKRYHWAEVIKDGYLLLVLCIQHFFAKKNCIENSYIFFCMNEGSQEKNVSSLVRTILTNFWPPPQWK